MQTLTEEQIGLFEQMEQYGLPEEMLAEEMTDEECDVYIDKHLKVTAASSGGMYPNCSVSGGSCSGC